jgi:hypothetical protein
MTGGRPGGEPHTGTARTEADAVRLVALPVASASAFWQRVVKGRL